MSLDVSTTADRLDATRGHGQPRGVALVVVTPNESPRMGPPKPLLPFRERCLLRRAVAIGVASKCRPIVVVMGSLLPVVIEALAALDEIEGTVIVLSDQGLLTADVVNRIMEAHYRTGKEIVASEYEDAVGAPLYVGKRFFDEIAHLNGRHGARFIADRHLEEVTTVPLADAAFDLYNPSQY